MKNACAHSVVLSEGLGGGRVLQVEHWGSDAAVGTMTAVGSVRVGAVSRESVQQGGGPVTEDTGERSSWKDVAMSVGSVAVLGAGISSSASTAAGFGEGVSDVLVPTALSMRSKCLVIS